VSIFSVAYLEYIANTYLIPTALNVLVAIVVFFVGRWIARLAVRASHRLMEQANIDISLRKFLNDVLYAILLVVVVTASLDQMGVRTTAVLAVLGAAGLAIGLALQGSLSNFAAGVMLIVLRPYKVGDVVLIGKYDGRVEAIKVFHTILVTSDNREITIPNGQIISGPIENMTVLGKRRVDMRVAVTYDTDLRQAKELLEGILAADNRVLSEPAPSVDIAELAGAGVKFSVRPWVHVKNHDGVYADTLERVKKSFDTYGIKMP
jgi:small conductance mechanosensitive channel